MIIYRTSLFLNALRFKKINEIENQQKEHYPAQNIPMPRVNIINRDRHFDN